MFNKNLKLISVIVPFYNQKKFLKRSISSVLNQTYSNLEIILIDDGSRDGSYEIAKEYEKTDKRVKLIKLPKNLGQGYARNLGIKKSKGEYITFLDSDDYWYPKKIEKQLSAIKNYDFCSTACDYIDEKFRIKSGFFLNYLRLFLQKFFLFKISKKGYFWFYIYNPVIISSVMIKTVIIKNLSFSNDKTLVEDLLFWIKIFRKNKIKFIFLPFATVTITRNTNSDSSNKVKEFSRIIQTIVSHLISTKKFKFLSYIIVGIILRSIKFFIHINYNKVARNFKPIFLVIFLLYFIIFYSPLFWHLGKPLLKYNPINIEKKTNIVILSGTNDFEYYPIKYRHRYEDLKKVIKNKNIYKIYFIGKTKDLPTQKILEKLLIFEGFKKNKIEIIYEDFNNNKKDIKMLNQQLKKDNISNLIILSSPYTSLYNFNMWSKYTEYKILIMKSDDWPIKNNFFQYSKNKKIIIQQYFVALKSKIFGY